MSNERRTFSDTAVQTTLGAGINDSVESFTIAAATGWPTGSGGDFFASITNASTGAIELIRCESRTTTTITVKSGGRGYGSTAASAYSGGETVKHVLSAEYDANEANLAVYQILSQATAAGQIPVVSGAAAYTMVQGKTSGQILVGNGTTIASVAVSGDATLASTGALTIPNDTITYAKMQNVTTDRLLGRDTAGSGDTEELTVGGGVEFTGSTGIQRSALTGVVTASAGSGTTAFATGTGPVYHATSAPGSPVDGDLWYDTDDELLFAYNGTVWVCLTPKGATVATSQTTTSTSFTDLATSGPAVTLLTATKARITLSCWTSSNTATEAQNLMGFAVSGATTIAAADASAGIRRSNSTNSDSLSSIAYIANLTAGSNTFTAKYRVTNDTGTFLNRNITVEALG